MGNQKMQPLNLVQKKNLKKIINKDEISDILICHAVEGEKEFSNQSNEQENIPDETNSYTKPLEYLKKAGRG